MIHIIVASHGAMAEGMVESAKMLIGENEFVSFVSFLEEMGMEELQEEFERKIANVSGENQYLILCDIKGGTPFNVVSRYSFRNDNVAVIYGVNLPILIEAITGRDGETLAGLTKYLQRTCGESIGLSEL